MLLYSAHSACMLQTNQHNDSLTVHFYCHCGNQRQLFSQIVDIHQRLMKINQVVPIYTTGMPQILHPTPIVREGRGSPLALVPTDHALIDRSLCERATIEANQKISHLFFNRCDVHSHRRWFLVWCCHCSFLTALTIPLLFHLFWHRLVELGNLSRTFIRTRKRSRTSSCAWSCSCGCSWLLLWRRFALLNALSAIERWSDLLF